MQGVPRRFKPGLGTLQGFKATIQVDKEASPVFCNARAVPYAMTPLVEELDRLQQEGVITLVAFSDWAAPIVPVLKSDKSVRICGDFKMTVNKVSKLDRYPIPKIEDLCEISRGEAVHQIRPQSGLPTDLFGRRIKETDHH